MQSKVLLLVCISFFISSYAQTQKKRDVVSFIEKLPTIEYGVMPYWEGVTTYWYSDRSECLVHGFPYHYKDTINSINNNLLMQAISDSSYVIIDKKKVKINPKNIRFEKKYKIKKWSFSEKDDIDGGLKSKEEDFFPGLYASAKSILNNKYYVVYLWRALNTETVFYYSLVFDFKGNLLSYQHLDYWLLEFPLYPYDDSNNFVRAVDHSKSEVRFLPNGLLLARDIDVLTGNEHFEIIWLNNNGHYELMTQWDEVGELGNYNGSKYENYFRYSENENTGESTIKNLSLIPFAVQDPDGFSNIRKASNSSSEVIRTIKDGDIVFGTYLSNGWIQIKFTAEKNGKITNGGYIHSSRLKQISDKYNKCISLPSREDWQKKIRQ